MILNTTDSPRAGRWVKLIAGATLIGWTGFALSGASAAAMKSDAKKKARPALEQSALPVEGREAAISVEPIVVEGQEAVPLRMAIRMTSNGEGGGQTITLETAHFVVVGGPEGMEDVTTQGPMQLFAFQGGPGAHGIDLDGDGNVTPEEHDAFVVAKAMANPAAVLAQFPGADSDQDGTLSADEAADLVGGPFTSPLAPPPPPMAGQMLSFAPQISGEGQIEIVFEAQTEDSEPAMTMIAQRIDLQPTFEIALEGSPVEESGVWVRSMPAAEGCAEAPVEVDNVMEAVGVPFLSDLPLIGNLFRTTTTESTADVVGPLPTLDHVFTATAVEGQPLLLSSAVAAEPALPPAAWIMTNIDAQPTKEDIAAQVDRTQAAALRRFLKMHPKSDRNEDGLLTVEERDAFIDKMQSTSRERYLKANPEADTNEDGILTPAEMRSHQRSQREARAEARGAVRVRHAERTEALPGERLDGPK